jgi:hypothetical protein
MLRALSMVFERSEKVGKARALRRQAPAMHPEIEPLGARLLLTVSLNSVTGIGTSSISPIAAYFANNNYRSLISPVQTPTASFPVLDLVNHSVDLKGPAGGDIGTVTFTSVSGTSIFSLSSFQGTFVGSTPLTPSVQVGDKYSATIPIGPIPVSGTIGTPQAVAGGGYTWSISFSGTFTGTATETHTYYDSNGNMQTETWMVPDHQTVNFSGTMTGYGSNLSFNGSITVGVNGDWMGPVFTSSLNTSFTKNVSGNLM